MHIAIALRKPLILFNNIFNRHEFELYGRGEILEPSVPCDCYYQPKCARECMRAIEVPRVVAACLRHLPRLAPGGSGRLA
jgi:heptosyltransferase-2